MSDVYYCASPEGWARPKCMNIIEFSRETLGDSQNIAVLKLSTRQVQPQSLLAQSERFFCSLTQSASSNIHPIFLVRGIPSSETRCEVL